MGRRDSFRTIVDMAIKAYVEVVVSMAALS